MIIRITQKARDQIKLKNVVTQSENKDSKFLEEWYVHIFILNRHKYFIFTESKSYFSIISYAKGITNRELFIDFMIHELTNALNDLIPNLHLFQGKKDNIIFTKTISKSVLKVQSDHIYHALRPAERGVNAYEINRLMLSCIDYKTPENVFIDEMNKLLLEYKEINLKRNQMN